MPISEIDGLNESHWLEVKDLIQRAATEAGYKAELVSADTDVGIIQKRIVRALYEHPVVVCDVSCKNSNVMLELGMRLAFDKPVILIKDDKTAFSFDTSPLEHLVYPRGLRFSAMENFVSELSKKISAVEKRRNDDSFLKSFGSFKVAELNVESAPVDEVILSELSEIRARLHVMSNERREVGILPPRRNSIRQTGPDTFTIRLDADEANALTDIMESIEKTRGAKISYMRDGHNGETLIELKSTSRDLIMNIEKILTDIIPF